MAGNLSIAANANATNIVFRADSDFTGNNTDHSSEIFKVEPIIQPSPEIELETDIENQPGDDTADDLPIHEGASEEDAQETDNAPKLEDTNSSDHETQDSAGAKPSEDTTPHLFLDVADNLFSGKRDSTSNDTDETSGAATFGLFEILLALCAFARLSQRRH